ncbi:hypothetical protein Ahu01nite_094340 [Winogradskya humida]|uniref:Uncharacterized protein n=1 Tax=Winogradskya humida TaxID=113566 RepID=A0ABQ4A7P0_9ACTN|nr:hypothetical protein Ahu01nite_094340 [Actinoplanes humidus]
MGLVGAVHTEPLFNVYGAPHLALGEVGNRFGEVSAAGDLVGPLSADPAQPDTNFMGTEKTVLLR